MVTKAMSPFNSGIRSLYPVFTITYIGATMNRRDALHPPIGVGYCQTCYSYGPSRLTCAALFRRSPCGTQQHYPTCTQSTKRSLEHYILQHHGGVLKRYVNAEFHALDDAP